MNPGQFGLNPFVRVSVPVVVPGQQVSAQNAAADQALQMRMWYQQQSVLAAGQAVPGMTQAYIMPGMVPSIPFRGGTAAVKAAIGKIPGLGLPPPPPPLQATPPASNTPPTSRLAESSSDICVSNVSKSTVISQTSTSKSLGVASSHLTDMPPQSSVPKADSHQQQQNRWKQHDSTWQNEYENPPASDTARHGGDSRSSNRNTQYGEQGTDDDYRYGSDHNRQQSWQQSKDEWAEEEGGSWQDKDRQGGQEKPWQRSRGNTWQEGVYSEEQEWGKAAQEKSKPDVIDYEHGIGHEHNTSSARLSQDTWGREDYDNWNEDRSWKKKTQNRQQQEEYSGNNYREEDDRPDDQWSNSQQYGHRQWHQKTQQSRRNLNGRDIEQGRNAGQFSDMPDNWHRKKQEEEDDYYSTNWPAGEEEEGPRWQGNNQTSYRNTEYSREYDGRRRYNETPADSNKPAFWKSQENTNTMKPVHSLMGMTDNTQDRTHLEDKDLLPGEEQTASALNCHVCNINFTNWEVSYHTCSTITKLPSSGLLCGNITELGVVGSGDPIPPQTK